MRNQFRRQSKVGLAAATLLLGLSVIPTIAASGKSLTARTSNSIVLQLPAPFNPIAPSGGHDLYHCSLLNPHVATDQMITKAVFAPGNKTEDHHAIVYLVRPADVAQAQHLDNNGSGWTCFGGTGINGSGLGSSQETPWLAGWSPGHNISIEPTGTGVPLPAGSMVVLQMHYNLLSGHWADRTKVTLTTTDQATSGLTPLSIDLLAAPIDAPCPKGITGKLCNRAASLADIGRRFGQSAVSFDNGLDYFCNGPTPKASVTSHCMYRYGAGTAGFYIWAVTPHMHLLGVSMSVTLNPGTPQAKVLVNDTNYDFHFQHSFLLSTPQLIVPGDKIQVSCTYNPVLRTQLAFLKKLPPRYILWADGSSDEMCLASMAVTNSLPGSSTSVRSGAIPTTMHWDPVLVRALNKVSFPVMPTMTDSSNLSLASKSTRLQQIQLSLDLCG